MTIYNQIRFDNARLVVALPPKYLDGFEAVKDETAQWQVCFVGGIWWQLWWVVHHFFRFFLSVSFMSFKASFIKPKRIAIPIRIKAIPAIVTVIPMYCIIKKTAVKMPGQRQIKSGLMKVLNPV